MKRSFPADQDYLRDSKGEILYPKEGTSFDIVGIPSHKGSVITKASLLSLTLTLFDEESNTIINSLNNVSVLDINGGTVNNDGQFTIRLDESDNPIINSLTPVGTIERHIARIRFTWNDGTRTRIGEKEIIIPLRKKATPIDPN
jgi:hypothetical protein